MRAINRGDNDGGSKKRQTRAAPDERPADLKFTPSASGPRNYDERV
jgi:hypothetical protein